MCAGTGDTLPACRINQLVPGPALPIIVPDPGKEGVVQHEAARFVGDHSAHICRHTVVFQGYPAGGNVKIGIIDEDVCRADDDLLQPRRQGAEF